jgi:prepilin-type N-terminal cleavage/methylation domain-containing protein
MKKGFTIVELLVSIAIIALVVAIVLISISNAREKSRDARRMTDMQEISKALNLYNNNTNQYPIGDINAMTAALENAGTISKVPLDPLNSGSYIYTYTSTNGINYTLGFCLETNTIQGYSQGCHTIAP